MPNAAELQSAIELLAYWKKECEAAERAKDAVRIARCQKFIAQCELVISALQSAKS
jgi:hypothetical protein